MASAKDLDFLEYSAEDEGDVINDDALTAEFRARLGLLSDDEEGLTDVFKARLGADGLSGVNQVEEVEVGLQWEKDETIKHFKFAKIAKEKFQNGVGPQHSTEPLTASLFPKKHEIDELASIAVWLAIQRFMGDIPNPKESTQREKVPIMTKVYRALEAHVRRATHQKGGAESKNIPKEEKEVMKIKDKKKSSLRRFFGGGKEKSRSSSTSSNGHQENSSDYNGSGNLEYVSDPESMLEKIPHHDLDLIHFVAGHGILRRELRDEIFAQLCKQLTGNSSRNSQTRGWILMTLCAGCFIPSDVFLKYLQCFIKDATPDVKDTYAGNTKKILIRSLANGLRYHPPNWLEFQAANQLRKVTLSVTFADGRTEQLETDAATTASEMCLMLSNKVGLKDQFGFSVYICIYDKVSSLGNGLDHVMDAISECEQVVRSKGQKEEDAPWRLYYRKEAFTPWHDPSYDDVSTELIYQQVARGVKNGEYKVKGDELIAKVAAQRYFIDTGTEVVPGKLQAAIANYIPEKKLKEKGRDYWTQAIITSTEGQGFSTGKVTHKKAKEDFVIAAPRRWPMHFSALFEAFKITGPSLPRNDVVVAVNNVGVFIMDEPYRVVVGMHFYEIVEIFCSRTGKMRGQSFSLVTVKGDEFTFISPNSQAIADLVSTFLIGLRRRSKYAVGLQEFVLQGEQPVPFNIKQGDLVILMENVSDHGAKSDKKDWAYGECAITGARGSFPLDCIYILPSLERPPDEFLNHHKRELATPALFLKMSAQDTMTLPRKRGAVQLAQATIGRHGKYGKASDA